MEATHLGDQGGSMIAQQLLHDSVPALTKSDNYQGKSDLIEGSVIHQRYELRKVLSTKTGKRTFLAWDYQVQQSVVIKLLLFDQGFQWSDLKLFEREASVLKNLNDPSIPRYLDYFEFAQDSIQGFALVQTYIDAPNLEQLIQQGRRFSEDELITLAEQLLKVLDQLHRIMPPVVHRDIKPSNVLLRDLELSTTNDSDNSDTLCAQAHLIDFGSVQASAMGESGTITIVGSYGYIPLEQFGGQAVPASDLYSLGMMLLFLATGHHPSELPQSNGRVQVAVPQMSQGFQRWLGKLTHPHLEQRFSSAQEALEAIDHEQFESQQPTRIEYGPEGFVRLHFQRIVVDYKNNREQLIVHLKDGFSTRQSSGNFATQAGAGQGQRGLGESLSSIFSLFIGISIWILMATFLGNLGGFIGFAFLPIFTTLPASIRESISDQKLIISQSFIRLYAKNTKLRIYNSREEISLLTYTPSYVFEEFWDDKGEHLNRGKVVTQGELCIYAGDNKYSIKKLSPAEFWWLGQELSAYLDLDLQVIYSTPKVPPEPAPCGGC